MGRRRKWIRRRKKRGRREGRGGRGEGRRSNGSRGRGDIIGNNGQNLKTVCGVDNSIVSKMLNFLILIIVM